jgi:2-dehydropantoate 2-reductase
MRMLIVGAGAIGGYFGGRLLAAGRDVTFLVRKERAERLALTGLVLRSPMGDATLPAPPTVLAGGLREPFDVVLLSCKAYDLEGAVEAFAPGVGPDTAILPLLNGMAHLEVLDRRFGAGRVLGGLCVISTALDAEGRIVHYNTLHSLSFGARDGSRPERAEAIAALLSGAGFDLRHAGGILQEMWEKWVFIAAAAGLNCLMRAAVCDIVKAGGAGLATELLDECAAIAAGQGFPPREAALARSRATLTDPSSPMVASMLRDVERGGRVEADHVLGDLLRRGDAQAGAYPLLRLAYAHLKAYEARREREA